MSETFEQIKALELLLLDPKTRKSPNRLDDLICDEFIELGQSGTLYDKADIISALNDDPYTNAVFSDFDIQTLSPNLMLVNYISRNKTTIKRHSLWEKQAGKWRILYHEAETPHG